MFTKIRMKEEKGFTLIELLIVVAIIGILAAIAIPQFGAYRKRGYNAAATSDLRSIRTTEEAMMADFQDYGASAEATQTGTPYTVGVEVAQATYASVFLAGGVSTTTSQSVSLSPKVVAAVKVTSPGANLGNTAYAAVANHQSGDNFYGADSDVTTLYRKGFTTWAATNTSGACPTSLAGATDFVTTGAGAWAAM